MSIILFLARNWDNAVLIVTAVTSAVFFYKKTETKLIKEILFRLVTQAEAEFGGGTGELKRAAVIEWLYERLPPLLRPVITAKHMERLIDDVLACAKKKWDANPKLKEYISGGTVRSQG